MGASAVTTDWVVRSTAKTVMSALALAGITGIYLRQRARVGLLGLAGYLLLSLGYLLMLGTEYLAAFVLPTVAKTSPGYVNDVIVTAFGGHAVGDIGPLLIVFSLMGVGYALGGLLFGIATFRAGILSRCGSAPPRGRATCRRWPWPCCRTRSTVRWPSPPASPSSGSASPCGVTSVTRRTSHPPTAPAVECPHRTPSVR